MGAHKRNMAENSSMQWDASSLLANSPKHSRRKEGDAQMHRTYESKLHNSPNTKRDISKMTFELDTERYIELLRKLIDESVGLQNSPSLGLIPKEDNAARHVMEHLQKYTTENGGPLIMEHLSVLEGVGISRSLIPVVLMARSCHSWGVIWMWSQQTQLHG